MEIVVFRDTWRRCIAALLWTLGLFHAAAWSADKPSNMPMSFEPTDSLRSFDDKDFALAYDVLLGAGDLKRAFLIAQKAVQESPADRLWRRKLARVSSWTQHPEVAAQQWLALFKMGDRTLEVIQGVVVGANLIMEPQWILQAWAALARHQPLSPAQWQDILTIYEEDAEPLKGSIFFEEEFNRLMNPVLLEYAGRLAEDAGEDARAIRLYSQRAAMVPFSMDVMLKAVVLMIRINKLQDALDLMQAYQHQVPTQAKEYWYLLGEVAWQSRHYGVAKEAYTHYIALPEATSADWSRLIYLVRQDYPAQAADLAIQAFRRFASTEQLLYGLGIYAELGDGIAQERVLSSLDRATIDQLVTLPQFLMLRAQLYQRQGKSELAWADYRLALQQNPDDANAVLANLWFLIDNHRIELLRSFVRKYASVALRNAVYWQAFGAANQTLERHRETVAWYAKAAMQDPQDPLMLLNYADALERIGQVGMAERMRRHAWALLKQKYPQPVSLSAAQGSTQLLALARLTLIDQPGDPGLELVHQWVQQIRGVPDAPANEQTAVLVLGWAISKEQFHNARNWMWSRYARQSQSAPPIWGDSQTALQLQETQTMNRQLMLQGDAMPIYNRYDTAYALGHFQQAIDIAFQGMSLNADEPLYDRYRQHVPAQSSYIQVQLEAEKQSALDIQGMRFETRLVVDPKLYVTLRGSHQQQTGKGALMRPITPDAARISSLEILWKGSHGDTRMALARREELDGLMSFQLTQNAQWGGHLNLEGGLDIGIPTSVSLPLRVAGYENGVYGAANYTLGRREYFRVAPRHSRYFTPWGDALGTSNSFDAEFGYRLRTEYPDWKLRFFLTRQLFSREPDVSTLVIPESSTNLGVCWNMGENVSGQNMQTTYTRAWRPFFDFCFNNNSVGGNGIRGSAGLAGSLTGEDHLLLQLQRANDTQPGASPTQSLVVRYRRYF
jgi:predicted Zn-dependent protease